MLHRNISQLQKPPISEIQLWWKLVPVHSGVLMCWLHNVTRTSRGAKRVTTWITQWEKTTRKTYLNSQFIPIKNIEGVLTRYALKKTEKEIQRTLFEFAIWNTDKPRLGDIMLKYGFCNHFATTHFIVNIWASRLCLGIVHTWFTVSHNSHSPVTSLPKSWIPNIILRILYLLVWELRFDRDQFSIAVILLFCYFLITAWNMQY